jgi:predicted ATPase with chaperone activity
MADLMQHFFPAEPQTLADTGLPQAEVEGLMLKLLMNRGDTSGRDISAHIRLPLRMLDPLLRGLKDAQLVVYSGSAHYNDFVYRITERGRELARDMSRASTYFGAAPVPLAEYVVSVAAQAPGLQKPALEDLQRAFDGLLLSDRLLARLGPAINSGRAMFLHGDTGNGKTSIASRLASVYHEEVWIPRAIGVSGTVVRLYDPIHHKLLEEPAGAPATGQRADARWVRIARPTILAGGELTLQQLEVATNPSTGIGEAPLQLKANCGTLVIDDFGRQQMHVSELLNRWIVPLELRRDNLHMADGKTVEVPFEQFVVFSTNLEPKHLVDEAFLRRIPYKVKVPDPTEAQFHELFRRIGEQMGIDYDREVVESLIAQHYRRPNRPMRFCHPRDLLLHVINDAEWLGRAPVMSAESLDAAVEGYFVE